jgi:hypothetical protein
MFGWPKKRSLRRPDFDLRSRVGFGLLVLEPDTGGAKY